MNRNTLLALGAAVALLAVALFFVEMDDDGGSTQNGELLLPMLRNHVDDVDQVTMTRSGNEPIIINKVSGQWRVAARNGYPANVAAIRAVLLAMTETKVMEKKTANPDLHSRLGVSAPSVEGSKGTLVAAAGDGFGFQLIFGNVAQGNYRYARLADQDQAWLIDQNPEIPATAGEWLATDIIDIDATRVRSVTITHPDGESIRASKTTDEATNFDVADIPAGRELSYSTVANGLGGALNDLDLDDVRTAVAPVDAVVTEFGLFDGLTIVVDTTKSEEQNWIAIRAQAADEAAAEADEINARVAGWQYLIADYKANLLTRRWEEILRAADEE